METDTGSLQWIEYFRTASFRIAIWYAAPFAISVVILAVVMSWVLTAELMAGVRSGIGQHSTKLLSIYAK